MKEIFFTFALCFVCALAQAKTNIIFDTDMGNDVDDALALNMLYGYQQKGLADIKAILINKDNPYSAVYVSIQNCHYNINVPIAAAKNAPKNTAHKNEHPNGKFIGKIADAKNADNSYKYKRTVFNGYDLIDPVKLARKTLSECADNSVVYISVGFSTNVAALLKSAPDDISPLSGTELVAKKVKFFSVMAGQFGLSKRAKRNNPEFNVYNDPNSARYFVQNCPVDIVFSGFEVGEEVGVTGKKILNALSDKNPLKEAYILYAGVHGNARTWDLTSVLYVFNPEIFDISERGTVCVNDKIRTDFTANKDGKHRFLILKKGSEPLVTDALDAAVLSPKEP